MTFFSQGNKVVFWAALGGTVLGLHIGMIVLNGFAAWKFFNAILGAFLVYVSSLFARDLIFRETENPYSHRDGDESNSG
ncbi:MAG: hypothetical protein KDD64_01340 [Bdellovibrionales bacterium]|nr:hypothetical protein [Bdellovibrionales bacterium]